jgi:hypothetical protein
MVSSTAAVSNSMYTVEGRTSERKRTAGRGEEGGTKVGEDAYRRQSPLAAIQEEAGRSRARGIDRVSGGAALCAKGYAEIEFQMNTEAGPSETFSAQNLGRAGWAGICFRFRATIQWASKRKNHGA